MWGGRREAEGEVGGNEGVGSGVLEVRQVEAATGVDLGIPGGSVKASYHLLSCCHLTIYLRPCPFSSSLASTPSADSFPLANPLPSPHPPPLATSTCSAPRSVCNLSLTPHLTSHSSPCLPPGVLMASRNNNRILFSFLLPPC